jgi:hypothetical protein
MNVVRIRPTITVSVDDILATLPKLTPEQLRIVRATADMLYKGGNENRREGSTFELSVLSAIVEELKPHVFISVDLCRGSSMYPSFRDKMPKLEKSYNLSKLSQLEKLWITKLGLRLMIRYYKENGALIDGAFLMARIDRLPTFINRAFPGYASNGLLKWIRKHGK